MNPCGANQLRQCADWPRSYLKVPSTAASNDMFSTVLIIDVGGVKIDFEREKSFSVPIRVRDRYVETIFLS